MRQHRMTLGALILTATKGRLPREAHEQAADALHLPLPDVFDQCARTVAQDYLHGHLTWADADAAINELQAPLIRFWPHLLNAHSLIWRVFLAFDEGEWDHENPFGLQGEELTTALLREIEGLRRRALQMFRPSRAEEPRRVVRHAGW
jgi:hypothetical protein